MMHIGLEIRDYLKQEGRSQTWLSDRAGIPIHRLNMGLCGKRNFSLEEYALICGTLGVSTNRFLKPMKPGQ
ncbi:MAG: helix-turn-helix transcriptional regulator [Clostridia bacterium]|nr:helix-turn-helix transcriptional regulator [Clostridia bacterium]